MWFVSAQLLCPLVRFYRSFFPRILPKFVNVDAVLDGAAPPYVFILTARFCAEKSLLDHGFFVLEDLNIKSIICGVKPSSVGR